MKQGDCSTCGYSVGNRCQFGNGQATIEWQEGKAPNPCPSWMPQGEQWQIMQEAWYKRNPWPFKTNFPCNQDKS